MSRNDNWAASWVNDKTGESGLIKKNTLLDKNHLSIIDTSENSITVGCISVEHVSLDDVRFITNGFTVDFIVNIKKESLINGIVLSYCAENSIGIGQFGDLLSALNSHIYRDYRNKESQFILRGLQQHDKVTNVSMINNRKYRIERLGMKDVILLALNDYEITADVIRKGISIFGECDAILASNPNCRFSSNSKSVATSLDISVYKWAELLGVLNKNEV